MTWSESRPGHEGRRAESYRDPRGGNAKLRRQLPHTDGYSEPRQGRHHQEYAAPTELGNPSRTRFYKDAAPTALWLATRSYSDGGHEGVRWPPEREGRVRCGAWLAPEHAGGAVTEGE